MANESPIEQLGYYLINGIELEKINPEVSILIGQMVMAEAEHILDMRTKTERREALSRLPDNVRSDVERGIMMLWKNGRKGVASSL